MQSETVEKPERLTYTAQEVADLLGVEHKTVRRALEKGQIPSISIGRLKRIPRKAFHRMLDNVGGAVDELI